MMDHVFAVRNWSELFETSESRKVARPLEWVKMRTKHDGRSYRRVTRMRQANQALLGWYLILQVAAKMPARGVLADLDGPLDAVDLADKTGIAKSVFQIALISLADTQVGWIERLEWKETLSFWDNVGRLGLTPGYFGRHRRASGRIGTDRDGKSSKTEEPFPREPGRTGTQAVDDGTAPEIAGQIGTDRDATGQSGVHKNRIDNSTVPPTVPQGGQGDALGIEEAKEFLHRLFERKLRTWSYEEQELLTKIVPIRREDARLIKLWFELPGDHEVFTHRRQGESTRRKQELTTFLRDYNGELDKIHRFAPLFDLRGRRNGLKKEPPRWREFFRWKYPEANLPSEFERLDSDQKKEYERDFSTFQEAVP